MKKKNFLSGIGAKLALLTLAISGALMTGCYKDDGLDVTTPGGGGSQVLEDAVYTITGTVTDIETGQDIAGTLTYTGETTPVSFNGSYTVKIAKFSETQKTINLSFTANDAAYNNGNPINRTVVLDKVEDGQAVVYPLSVAMKKHVTMKQRLYDVTYIFKNAVTGEQITDMPAGEPTVTPAPVNGLYEAKDYTITTAAVADKYKSSITILSLPYVESEDGKNIDKTVELLITPVDPEKEHTYTTLSGVIVDKNGNSLLAESIKLVGNNNQPIPGKEVTNSTNFAFTLDNIDEAGDYKIEATVKGLSAVYSGIYSVPACGNQNITIMVTEEAEMYPVQYTLTYVYKNAVTGENVVDEGFNPTVTPKSDNEIYEAGEYVITTSEIDSKFMSSVTNVTLPYAETKDQTVVINKVIVISVTPIDSKQTYTTLSGTIVDNNGRPLTAEIDLLKNGQKVAGKSVKGTNFVFTLNDVDDAGDYKISATADGKNVESGVYTVPACGNQVITLGFTEIGLKDVVYDLAFEARNAETLDLIYNAKFVFNGKEAASATVNPGTYTLSASATGYFTGTMNIELPAIQNESGEIDRTITIYLTEEEKEVKTVVLMGEVVDALGNMITAQSIKLEGSNLALYDTDHFLFEVELPALTRNNPQWTVTAKVSRTSTPSGKPLAPFTQHVIMGYDPSTEVTAINQNIIIPIVADGNGNITIPDEEAEQGGGEQGSVDPGVDPETGKVEESKEIVMAGDGTEEDKTVITIDAGTVITTSDGSPLLSPIVLTRNVKEEKDPTVNPEEKEIIQPAVLRSFFGNPDGAQFKEKPLTITFADPYAGQLGSLQLEYKIDGLWGTSLKNQNNEVVTDGQEYTMLVSHFSQFRAVIKGKLDSISSKVEYVDEYFKEVNQQNNTDKTENLKITFKDAPTGAMYLDLIAEMEKASFTNENAQSIIKSTINNLFASKGSLVSDEFGKQNTDLDYAVAPYTLVKSITVKTKYKTTTYTYTLNGKTINVVVKSVLKHEVTAETVEIGHGHSHGHGDNLNAGGGIIVSE